MASVSRGVPKKPLGEILVDRNIITREQLASALERQKKEKGKYLGQILVEMGVPQEEITKAMDTHQHRRRVGEILLDASAITPAQLETALNKQKEEKKSRKPIGRLCLELGYITAEQWMDAMAKHFVMPVVSLSGFEPSRSLQKLIGEKFAIDKKIVVLQNEEGKIRLALADPNLYFMEEMKKLSPLGKRIEFCLAPPSEIHPCLERLYSQPPPPPISPSPMASV